MNKSEFVDLVKEVGEYETKKRREKAISTFTAAVSKALAKKESIELVGFGKFETVLQKGKEGVVPGTNKKYKTSDKFVPKFKAGKGLKDAVVASKKRQKITLFRPTPLCWAILLNYFVIVPVAQ